MPRNDQAIRQWLLLTKLEASKGATLQELVDSLPDDFPKNPRTIRRDLEAWEASGAPLVNEHVGGKTIWKLMDGYRRIPALGFSPTELMALVFSRNLLKPLEGTEIAASLNSALAKAGAALPPQNLEHVRRLEQSFAIGLGPHKRYRQYKGIIDRVSEGIGRARTAQIRYFSAARNKATRREVDPYRLWYAAGGLYLIAYCHLRKDVRMFAVERIRSVSLTDHPYQMPLGFNVEEYVQDVLMVMRGRRVEMELLFSKAAAAWVKDKVWHSSQKTSLLKDGRLKMTLKVADTSELVGWLLSFGSQVRVVRPDALRQKVKEEAGKIFRS